MSASSRPLRPRGGEHGRDSVRRIDWRSRGVWLRIGCGLTAAWLAFVILVTGNDVTHPLLRYLFTVPLAGWIAGLVAGRVAGRVVARLWPPRSAGG